MKTVGADASHGRFFELAVTTGKVMTMASESLVEVPVLDRELLSDTLGAFILIEVMG